MTEWYTHYDAKEFSEVRNVQETLLLPDTTAKETERGSAAGNEGGAVPVEKPLAVKADSRRKPKTVAAQAKQKTGRVKKQA
jgi:hypothetical protein